MKLAELTQYLEAHAPLEYQESYDNSGLITGNPEMEITGAIISLDATEAVVDEAIEAGYNLVIAHHPIVFSGLKRFTGQNYVQRTIIKAIRNDIAIYAIHTNLDNVIQDGVNNKIAEKIGLADCRALLPYPGDLINDRPRGTGLIGMLTAPQEWSFFLENLKQKMQVGVVRYTRPVNVTVSKVAVCGGSGSFLLSRAIAERADVFITADFKYHEFFDANDRIMIADIGHYESEQFTIELIKQLIVKKFSNFALRSTKIITNPINYL
ncbi:MAG TPA: Nif3-like dinuclear metal center hexameric protein [Saprospiraceae bacterium]|jgi:dinuclear metal center YbgI/SA1388 family protein|nr:Nif3-like dinuclear metal center hexameric protein [Saprospiraceae bacterium]